MQLQTNIDGKLIQSEINAHTRKLQKVINDIIALKLPNETEILYVIEQAHNKKVKEIATQHIQSKAE